MKKLPKIIYNSIQFADDDHLKEQKHEDGGNDEVPAGAGKTGDSAAYDKRKEAFLGKFSASNNAPPDQGGDPNNESNTEAARQIAESSKAREDEVKSRKRPGENLPSILEGKRKAEAERDEFRTKAEKYEKEEKPALEAKIAEFEKKLEGDLSPAKVKEYEEKIVALETQQREKEEALVNENQKLKKTLSYHDLASSPEFKKEYEEPAIDAHRDAVKIIGTDQKKMTALHRALICNSAALSTSNPEDRAMAERERNDIIGTLLSEMNQFDGQQFSNSMTTYIKMTERHRNALQNHEKTRATIQEEAQNRATQAQADRIQTWGQTFKQTATQYDGDAVLTEDEGKLAKELGHDIELEVKKNNILAEKVITGSSSMTEAMEVIHRGRVAPVLKIRISVLEKQLADAKAVIAKMSKGGTGGGGSNPPGERQTSPGKNASGEKVNTEGKTREEWQRERFGAHRANV